MEDLQHRGQELYDNGDFNEAMVLRTRWYLAASYLMDPKTIGVGGTYFVEGEPGKTITVTRVDGVMAHGHVSGSFLSEAYPIAMLTNEPQVE
jgi:hypothetical protein